MPYQNTKTMLFTEYTLGGLHLKNRIVMPPMTRSRAGRGDVATALMAEYYSQRTGAGLLISEGTQISRQGQGYAWTPGIYSPEQVAGWKQVTDAVHANNGLIFAQLWYVGRVSHISISGKRRSTGSALRYPGRRSKSICRSHTGKEPKTAPGK